MRSSISRMLLGPRATGSAGAAAAASNLYPGTSWDLDATETDINTIITDVANAGTTTKITAPTLPQGTLAATTAATATALANAANAGSAEITLTANITGIASIHLARDVRINLAGYTIDVLRLDHSVTADAARRVHVVGPGKIGFVAKLFAIASAQDILIDGARISIEYMSTPDTTQYPIVIQSTNPTYYGVQRCGFVNCIVRGQSDEDKAAGGYLLQCEDVAFVNCNIAGGLNAPAPDDWGIRSDSSTRVWFVDSMIKGGTRKPPIRGDDMDSWVTWSTPSNRGTDRMLTLIQPDWGDIDPCLDNDGAHDDFGIILRLYNRWITGNNSAGGTSPLWGPGVGADFTVAYYLAGGIVLRSESSDWFSPTDMSDKEAAAVGGDGEVWNMDCLAGTPNTVTYADPVDSLIPSWPTVTGGASDGASFTVGSDPFVD